MLTATEQSDRVNKAQLKAFGEPITYQKADGDPIAAVGLPRRPAVQQSAAPGYFADLEVDPAVIPDPRKGDVVVWADGVEYVVARVVNSPYGLTTLVLHRKADA